MTSQQKSVQNFEEQLKHLETLVLKLESHDLPLDEALQCFEKGIQLSQQCQHHLKSAEQTVQMLLTTDPESAIQTEEFKIESSE